MADLGKAYVQIIPSAKGIKGAIEKELGGEAKSAGKSAGENFGGNLVSTVKKLIVAAGIGKILGDALNAGGAIQQSFGGLDTLYGEAAEAAKAYAKEAAAAGISANTYAEQAVSFGASLKSAFGGDMVAAANAANTAILDMADNSAKMGTDITAIQTAYQGFAKQNYTMLDNLKLGYGGTKTEMERLLKDAQALSGVEYNIDNLGDVYEAIHVIQDELGLTGVAADEAATTFTGSQQAMKAAWENLLADIALGNKDIGKTFNVLVESVGNFLFKNMLPMVGNVVKQIPKLFVSIITDGIPKILLSLGTLLNDMLYKITRTDFGKEGKGIIDKIRTSINTNMPKVFEIFGLLLSRVIKIMRDKLPTFLQQGGDFILKMVNGIGQRLPQLITKVGELLSKVLNTLMQKAPQFAQKGFEFVGKLASGILKNLPAILGAIGSVIGRLLSTIASNMPQLISKGFELISRLATGIVRAIPTVLSAIANMIRNMLANFSPSQFITAGFNMLMGIASGIGRAVGSVVSAAVNAAKQILSSVKSFFGIHSPSKVMAEQVGKWIPAGIAEGITDNMKPLDDAMSDLVDETVLDTNSSLNSALSSSNINLDNSSTEGALAARLDAMIYLMQEYYPEMAKGIDGKELVSGIDRALGLAVV